MLQMCDRAAAQTNIQNQSVQSYKRPNTAQEEINFLKPSSLIQVCFYKGEFPVSHAPPESERQRHREALITLKLLHRHAVTPLRWKTVPTIGGNFLFAVLLQVQCLNISLPVLVHRV